MATYSLLEQPTEHKNTHNDDNACRENTKSQMWTKLITQCSFEEEYGLEMSFEY